MSKAQVFNGNCIENITYKHKNKIIHTRGNNRYKADDLICINKRMIFKEIVNIRNKYKKGDNLEVDAFCIVMDLLRRDYFYDIFDINYYVTKKELEGKE